MRNVVANDHSGHERQKWPKMARRRWDYTWIQLVRNDIDRDHKVFRNYVRFWNPFRIGKICWNASSISEKKSYLVLPNWFAASSLFDSTNLYGVLRQSKPLFRKQKWEEQFLVWPFDKWDRGTVRVRMRRTDCVTKPIFLIGLEILHPLNQPCSGFWNLWISPGNRVFELPAHIFEQLIGSVARI